MEVVTLIPPSPNWFQSGVCDTSPHRWPVFAFAARSRVVILRFARPGSLARAATTADPRDGAAREGDPIVLCVLSGHKASAKLSSVCFVGSAAAPPLCASAGSDTQVLLWDVEAQKVLKSHKEHSEAVAVLAAPRDPDDCHHLLSLDDGFALVDWDTLSNERRRWRLPVQDGERPMSVAVLPSHVAPASPLAVGTSSGRVLLVDWRAGTVLAAWDAHAGDVQCIAPLPAGLRSEHAPPALLATSGRDAKARVWRLDGNEGHTPPTVLVEAGLPRPGGGKGGDAAAFAGGRSLTAHQRSRLWLTAQWTPAPGGSDPPALLTSSYLGDLLLWRLPRHALSAAPERGAPVLPVQLGEPMQLPEAHSRSVFRVARLPGPHPPLDAGAGPLWGASPHAVVPETITVSMDRSVAMLAREGSGGRFRVGWLLPCLGGYAYDVAAAPSSPLRLAVAVGDRTIRVWQRTHPLSPPVDVDLLWKGLTDARVCRVRWHPWHEEVLVYATEEGDVGCMHTLGESVRGLAASSVPCRGG